MEMSYSNIQGKAMAYYEHLPQEHKLGAWNFYESMDANGDGGVSLQEYQNFLTQRGLAIFVRPGLFNVLDKNGDGALDYNECITLYYILRLQGITPTQMQGNSSRVAHVDRSSSTMTYSNIQGKAMAYYENLPQEHKLAAWSFYKSMDANGDGGVSLQEYQNCLTQRGLAISVPPGLFNVLDKNGDGALDFNECITLYYMLRLQGITPTQMQGNSSRVVHVDRSSSTMGKIKETEVLDFVSNAADFISNAADVADFVSNTADFISNAADVADSASTAADVLDIVSTAADALSSCSIM